MPYLVNGSNAFSFVSARSGGGEAKRRLLVILPLLLFLPLHLVRNGGVVLCLVLHPFSQWLLKWTVSRRTKHRILQRAVHLTPMRSRSGSTLRVISTREAFRGGWEV